MTQRFTPVLGRDVALREESTDQQTWFDTFEVGYHVPPKIEPEAVLDLGANIGLTAAHYQVMWPRAVIVAVEMDANNAELAGRNFHGRVLHCAVGAASGRGSYRSDDCEESYSLLRPGDTEIRITTISELVAEHLLTAGVIFCKMDIEGSEWEVLEQGIDRRVTWLLVELHSEESSDERVERGKLLLETDGFVVERHTIHPHALWAVRQ